VHWAWIRAIEAWVGIEGGVLHLVDPIEAHETADRRIRQLLPSEQLTQQLQQAADRLVVPLGATGAGADHRCDPHDQLDLPRQQRVHIHELIRGGVLAAVGVELEIGPVAIKELPQLGRALGGLGEDALVHHIANVGGCQVNS
jgi:hypothetical protein